MSSFVSRSLAADVLEAAQRLSDAKTQAEVVEYARPAFLRLGAEVFVGVTAAKRNGAPDVSVGSGRTSSEWEARYAAEGHARHDPVVAHMLTSVEPAFWSDLTAGERPLSRAEDRVMGEARAFGLKEGFVAPVHHPGGGVSAVLAMGGELDAADPEQRLLLQLLCHSFGSASRALASDQQPRRLARREIHSLFWANEGFTDKQIARQLDLSNETIKKYMKSARFKLGASNRVEAVRRAASLGLLPAWLAEEAIA